MPRGRVDEWFVRKGPVTCRRRKGQGSEEYSSATTLFFNNRWEGSRAEGCECFGVMHVGGGEFQRDGYPPGSLHVNECWVGTLWSCDKGAQAIAGYRDKRIDPHGGDGSGHSALDRQRREKEYRL